jgi:hypothetical protein
MPVPTSQRKSMDFSVRVTPETELGEGYEQEKMCKGENTDLKVELQVARRRH